MQYRTMPKSSDKLSILGFGCMRLASRGRGGLISGIDKDTALRHIRYAIDNGVNYLDTAYPYHRGESERFLGQYVLKDGYREKVNIATKMPCFSISRKDRFDEILNKQLAKLQVDMIDYYLLHALDGSTWDRMKALGVIAFMDNIQRAGLIRHMGFSFHGNSEAFTRIVDEYDWDFAQVQYNILDEHYQAGIDGIRYAAKKGLGIIVMEPLRGGSLVGKMPKTVQEVYDSAPVKRSPADWAFSWIYDLPEVTLVLSGMNDDAHIAENIRIASNAQAGALTEIEHDVIAQARAAFLKAMRVPCTGCRYCLPCPAGINIPSSLKDLNNYHMFGKTGAKMNHMLHTGIMTHNGKPHWANACISCGKCEKACPQNIEIRQALKEVDQKLEGRGIKTVASVGRRFMARGQSNAT